MELEFNVALPPQLVFEYLTDMQKFASVHPIIQKIEAQPDGSYKVFERINVGFLPYAFTYKAVVEAKPETLQVVINATVMGITHIQMNFDLHGSGSSTVVNEHISFRSPLPIKSVLSKVFREQHTLLFQNMARTSKSRPLDSNTIAPQ